MCRLSDETDLLGDCRRSGKRLASVGRREACNCRRREDLAAIQIQFSSRLQSPTSRPVR